MRVKYVTVLIFCGHFHLLTGGTNYCADQSKCTFVMLATIAAKQLHFVVSNILKAF